MARGGRGGRSHGHRSHGIGHRHHGIGHHGIGHRHHHFGHHHSSFGRHRGFGMGSHFHRHRFGFGRRHYGTGGHGGHFGHYYGGGGVMNLNMNNEFTYDTIAANPPPPKIEEGVYSVAGNQGSFSANVNNFSNFYQ